MLGWLIREVTEVTGKTLGYVADEIGDIASAISDIPDTLEKAYKSTNEPEPEQPKQAPVAKDEDTSTPSAS